MRHANSFLCFRLMGRAWAKRWRGSSERTEAGSERLDRKAQNEARARAQRINVSKFYCPFFFLPAIVSSFSRRRNEIVRCRQQRRQAVDFNFTMKSCRYSIYFRFAEISLFSIFASTRVVQCLSHELLRVSLSEMSFAVLCVCARAAGGEAASRMDAVRAFETEHFHIRQAANANHFSALNLNWAKEKQIFIKYVSQRYHCRFYGIDGAFYWYTSVGFSFRRRRSVGRASQRRPPAQRFDPVQTCTHRTLKTLPYPYKSTFCTPDPDTISPCPHNILCALSHRKDAQRSTASPKASTNVPNSKKSRTTFFFRLHSNQFVSVFLLFISQHKPLQCEFYLSIGRFNMF